MSLSATSRVGLCLSLTLIAMITLLLAAQLSLQRRLVTNLDHELASSSAKLSTQRGRLQNSFGPRQTPARRSRTACSPLRRILVQTLPNSCSPISHSKLPLLRSQQQ